MSPFYKIFLGLSVFPFSLSLAQGKIIINGAKMMVSNSAYVVTGDVSLSNSSTLNINNASIKIGGAIDNNSGVFDVTRGTVEMNGSLPQTIPQLVFSTNKIKNLVIGNNVSLSGQDSITGVLSFTGSNRTFSTNDSLTLKSTAVETASLADVTNGGLNTGNTVTGKVIVERHLSARKAWRHLAIPTNTSQTMNQAWQEGAAPTLNPVKGYGTQLTGISGTAGGFDVYTATPSMKIYDSETSTWNGVTNSHATNIKSSSGYMVFVRGDRTAMAYNSTPTQTVLRTQGVLYTGDLAPIPVSIGKFISIGNPYASTLDMRNITRTGIKNFFYLWDPKLAGANGNGAYQTFYYNGSGYSVIPGMGSYGMIGSVNNYIQSGQAFLIQADSSGNSNIAFKESAKASGSTFVARPETPPQPQLLISLYGVNTDASTYPADGAIIMYDDTYSNNVDGNDADKLLNSSENLALKTNNTLLVMERRHTIVQKDTSFLNLTNMKFQGYRFDFQADQMSQPGLVGFLEDTYLHTTWPLDLNGETQVDFNIVNIPGSYNPDRFRIVFGQATTLPVTLNVLKAFRQNNDIKVEWKVENESNMNQYRVEKSIDGNHYVTAFTVAAHNTIRSDYGWLDVNPSAGYNYYRIVSKDVNDRIAYSQVVKVFMGSGSEKISIYPNPVTNGIINLQLENQHAGTYDIRLLNNMGQVIVSKHINHAEGSSTELIPLDRYASHDMYLLEVTKPDGSKVSMNVVY